MRAEVALPAGNISAMEGAPGFAEKNEMWATPIDLEEMTVRVQKFSFPALFIPVLLTAFFVGCGGYAAPGSNPPPTVSSLSPASAVAGGGAFALTVNGTGFVAGSTVQWKGSNRTTTFVSVTQLTANITAADILTAGTAAISVVNPATYGGTSAGSNFTISASLVSIVVSPSGASIPQGGARQFAATGTFADGTYQDVTASVVWGSSAPAVASINTAGLATGVAVGDTRISAASGAVSGSTPVTVSLTSPRFAYATNFADNTVSIFAVDAATGQFRPNGYVLTGGSEPNSVTVDPQGKFAFVANFNSDNITAFTINAETGALTAIRPPVATGNGPRSVTVDPSGKFAYVPNEFSSDVSVFAINANTGALTAVGPNVSVGNNPFSVTVDPTGKFAYVANFASNSISAFAINAGTGMLTAIGPPVAAGNGPSSITVDSTGRFAYVANANSNNISAFAINLNTGALTAIGSPVAAGTLPISVTLDPTGQFAYATNFGSGDISVYSLNASTGELREVGLPAAAGSLPFPQQWIPSGNSSTLPISVPTPFPRSPSTPRPVR